MFAFTRSIPWGGMALLSYLIASLPAHAQYYQNLSIGNAKALALGNAVTADPPGIDSIHFNPAGLYLATKRGNLTEISLVSTPKKSLTYTAQFTGELPDGFNGFDGCDIECLLANDGSDSTTYEVENFYSYVPWGGKTDAPVIAPRGGAAFLMDGLDITIGTSAYFLFNSGAELETGAPGSYPRKLLVGSDTVLLSPTISMQASDTLYLGIAFPIHYSGMELVSSMRLVNLYISVLNDFINDTCDTDQPSDYCADGGNQVDIYEEIFDADVEVEDTFTPSVNVGFLWKPVPWFTFGGVYQSQVNHEMEGDYEVRYAEGLGKIINTGIVDFIPNTPRGGVDANYAESGKVTVEQTLPAHYALGISMQVFPDLKLNIDYKKTYFSEWKEMVFEFDRPTYVTGIVGLLSNRGPNTFASPRGFEDGTNFAYGLEYQWNDNLALRLGYEMRESVIPANMRSPAFSIGGDLTLKAIGFNYRYSRTLDIDMSYAQIRSEQEIPAGSSYATTWDPLELYALYPGYDLSSTLELDMLLMGIKYYW